jgi:hypothetical protein
MTQPAITLEGRRRALDPRVPIAVPTASLRLLAEVGSSARSLPAAGTKGNWASVRC